jgi:hypothetical protein
MLITKGTIMRPVKYVLRFSRRVLVNLRSVLHTLSGGTISCKAEQAWDEEDMRIFPPRFAVWTIARLGAIWTFQQIDVWPNVTATCVWTVVILLRLKSREKGDKGAYLVQ